MKDDFTQMLYASSSKFFMPKSNDKNLSSGAKFNRLSKKKLDEELQT